PQHDAVAPVGGDEVALPGAAAADVGLVGPGGHVHAVGVAQGGGAVGAAADGVALHPVAARAVVHRVHDADDRDARAAVRRDDVAAADGVVVGAGDPDAVAGVAQGARAGGVGADVVALHHIIGGVHVPEHDARLAVGGDDVPRRGGAAADDVAARPLGEPDARAPVAQGAVAHAGGADVIALDDVTGRAAVEDGDAAPGVARDEVAGLGGEAADRVVAGPVADPDAVLLIREGDGAVVVGADEVVLHGVETRAGVGEHDALIAVAGDEVPPAEGAEADAVEAGPLGHV